MARFAHFVRALIGGAKGRPGMFPGTDAAESGEVLDEIKHVLGLPHPGAMAAYVRTFEQDVARTFGVKHAIGANSGTTALALALRALGVGPGDEVITVANSWITTVTSIVELGAKPCFVDICAQSGAMDPAALERGVGPRTKAIVPVHMYGQPVDMEAVCRVARARGVPVVEDACQGIGARFAGRPVGAFGAIGCLSFHPNKLVGAPADGGMLLTDDASLAERLRRLSEADWDRAIDVAQPRLPSRLPALAIPVLKFRLSRLTEIVRARTTLAEAWMSALKDVEGVRLLQPPPQGEASWRVVVAICEDRVRVEQALSQAGFHAGPMYDASTRFLARIPRSEAQDGLPVSAELLARQILLPNGGDVSDHVIEQICRPLRAQGLKVKVA